MPFFHLQLGWILLAFYLVPTFISVVRRHKDENAIVAVNLLFGWTVIGWFVAFIWALTGNVKSGRDLEVS
ncbi:superinfection immunity protein [Burkholderia ubonensis]|uniref:superinfection immunity protein n=1 Tax=Burkholderia ubonensis TaxID=101571 RepID=UPI0009B3D088